MRNLWRVCRCLALQMKVLSKLYSVVLYRAPPTPKKNKTYFFPFFSAVYEERHFTKLRHHSAHVGITTYSLSTDPSFEEHFWTERRRKKALEEALEYRNLSREASLYPPRVASVARLA